MNYGSLSLSSPENWLLTIAGSVQHWFDRPALTHCFINRQAARILLADGCAWEGSWLRRHLSSFNRGAVWADADWKNIHHYLQPLNNRGLWRFHSALEEFQTYFEKAVSVAKGADEKQAAFFLGAAAHLLQDLCVPHHAQAQLFDGHKEYETWAASHRHQYKAQTGGLYYTRQDPLAWLLQNAEQASALYARTSQGASAADYHQATQILLPLAQRCTAGLLERFSSRLALRPAFAGWSQQDEAANS